VDRDGRKDTLVFRADSGELRALLLQADGSRVAITIGRQERAGLRPVGYADVNGDGQPDVLWRNRQSGANELWLLRGVSFDRVALPPRSAGWRVAAFRPVFAGDQHADVLWHRRATGESTVWQLEGSGLAGEAALDPAPAGSVLAAVLDFDGDSFPDLAWKNVETGAVEAWKMRGASATALVVLGTIAPADAVAESGDLDGDGDDDLVWSSVHGEKRVVKAWFLEGLRSPVAGMAQELVATRHVVGLLDVDSDGRAEVITRKKWQEAQSYRAFTVLPTGSVDDSGAMHWNVEPVLLESLPESKFWSFLTAQ
jgi:hypothetical protein